MPEIEAPGPIRRAPTKRRNVNLLTSIRCRSVYSGLNSSLTAVTIMDSKPDIAAIIIGVCVAGYAALAIRYVAQHDLGFSLQHIRGAAIACATVIAALVAADFLTRRTT
jgi:hypothetical protein